jgi:hypothetical protein
MRNRMKDFIEQSTPVLLCLGAAAALALIMGRIYFLF